MYYSEMVKKAVNIMFEAHKKDFDKGGYPYVFHPFYLATKVDGENETCVALLHDVIEDHGEKYNFEYLENEGFNKEIIDALKLLTHKKDIPYMDYIIEISKNNIANMNSNYIFPIHQPLFLEQMEKKARNMIHI